jgi:sirohydrochlorin cobaltochelatase
MLRGVLLLAHGSRDPRWAEPLRAVADRLGTQAPDVYIELAFLEFMEPDFSTAASNLVGRGCTAVDVVPLFLGAGGHVRKDVGGFLAQAKESHPGVQWVLHATLGESPLVIAALASAAQTCITR